MQLKEGEKIPSLAGQAWQKMSKKEKEPYLEKVAEDRKRYEKEIEAYKKKACVYGFKIAPLIGIFSFRCQKCLVLTQ